MGIKMMYSFYKSRYLGNQISPEEFERTLTQAKHWLERCKRIYQVQSATPEQEKMALCAVAEGLYGFQRLQPDQMPKAVKIGSVSCSYGVVERSESSKEKELLTRAGMYLEISRWIAGGA